MFSEAPPKLAGISEIVAFPDSREGEFSLIAASLGKNTKKADLRRLPEEVHFFNLELFGKYLIEVTKRGAHYPDTDE
jgi:hypothetical protein